MTRIRKSTNKCLTRLSRPAVYATVQCSVTESATVSVADVNGRTGIFQKYSFRFAKIDDLRGTSEISWQEQMDCVLSTNTLAGQMSLFTCEATFQESLTRWGCGPMYMAKAKDIVCTTALSLEHSGARYVDRFHMISILPSTE